MEDKAKKLREQVETSAQEFENAKKNLTNYVNSCEHEFDEVVYDPIHTPAYTCPGDPPGTMGSDWRGPTHVSAHTEKRWKRTCQTCGEEQYTTKTNKSYKENPDFGDK